MKTISFFTFVACIVLLSGCGLQPTENTLYRIDLPSTWKVSIENNEEDDDVDIYTLSGQSLKGMGGDIVIVNAFVGEAEYIDDLFPGYKENFRDEVKSYVHFADVKSGIFKGFTTREMEYSGKEDGYEYKGHVRAFNDRTYTYFIVIQGSESFMQSDKAKQILDSFEIIKPEGQPSTTKI